MDFDRIAMLLHIVNECNPQSHPRLKPIFDRAMEELQAHADGTAPQVEDEEPVDTVEAGEAA